MRKAEMQEACGYSFPSVLIDRLPGAVVSISLIPGFPLG